VSPRAWRRVSAGYTRILSKLIDIRYASIGAVIDVQEVATVCGGWLRLVSIYILMSDALS